MPQWYGLFAPAGLPEHERRLIETEVLGVIRSPEIAAQLALSGLADPRGRDEFQALLATEFKRWRELIPGLGIKLE
jgi:tripartite-type tricarboxylate transporter receptor subunit TctC